MRDTDHTMSLNRLRMPFLNIARGRLCYFGSRFATLHRVMVDGNSVFALNFHIDAVYPCVQYQVGIILRWANVNVFRSWYLFIYYFVAWLLTVTKIKRSTSI